MQQQRNYITQGALKYVRQNQTKQLLAVVFLLLVTQ